MREEARVVIVGGGAMGVGLLYHLAHEGWTDTLLVEKGELTSGSTWHAAGLVPNFIGSLNMAKVHQHAIELYNRLEVETGLSAGFHRSGALRLAVKPEHVDWFYKVENALKLAGVECALVSPQECVETHPLITVDDVLLGFYTPNDGWTDPSMATNAMAAGARKLGAEISKKNRVTEKIEAMLPKDFPEIQAEVMMANILAGPLTELAPLFARLTAPDGLIVLSGVIESQHDEIIRAYQNDFDIALYLQQEEWICLSGRRKA